MRSRLDLNGAWDFRTDPDGEGAAQGWFQAEKDYPDTIMVPGVWQAQGFGPSRMHLRNDYQGKAWYRRLADVPSSWKGRRIRLHLGGVCNTADIYVNSAKVGSVDGFIASSLTLSLAQPEMTIRLKIINTCKKTRFLLNIVTTSRYK